MPYGRRAATSLINKKATMTMIPADVLKLCADHQATGALSSAFEHDVLRPLLGGRRLCAADIAKARDLPPIYVEQLLDCLVSLEVVDVQSDGYALTEGWRESLSNDHDRLRAAFGNLAVSVRRWFSLGPIHRGSASGESQEDEMFRTGHGLEAYLLGVRHFNETMSDKLAEVLEPFIRDAECRRVADVGGGHAAYTLKLLARHPQLCGDVLDLPSTLAVSRSLNKEHPQRDRLQFIETDARELIPDEQPYDLVMVNDLLHSFGREDKEKIVRNVLGIVRPNGLLVFTKFAHEERSPTRDNAFFSLKLFANTNGTGFLESDEATLDILQRNGARLLQSFSCGNKSGFVLQAAAYRSSLV